jgi:hypothetical protein
MWRSRDGSVWIDGELDVDVQGGVGGGIGFHRRVLDGEVWVIEWDAGGDVVDVGKRMGNPSKGINFVVVECLGVSDESTLSDPTCGGI